MPRYRPQQPNLIDPAGVSASAYPRPMAKTNLEVDPIYYCRQAGHHLTDLYKQKRIVRRIQV